MNGALWLIGLNRVKGAGDSREDKKNNENKKMYWRYQSYHGFQIYMIRVHKEASKNFPLFTQCLPGSFIPKDFQQ